MKRLLPFPFILAVFFGPTSTMPEGDTGTVYAATVAGVDAPAADGTSITQDAETDDEKDTPWAVVLPIAFAIPLATLLVPAFLRKRTAGH
jgi:hypothetical protein